MPAIEAEGIYKVFGKGADRAVDRLRDGTVDRDELREEGTTAAVVDATFTVEPGEIFVIMGLSGSGKSTVLRTVNGLLEPTAGSMLIDGQDTTAMSRKDLRTIRREKVSMVFQHFALFPHRTVGENAAYGLQVQGLNKADRERKADDALQMVGLEGWGNSLPGQLSGGMRQRVGLARALAAGTDIMLMDEAFSALDPLIRREMQDQLVELQNRLDKTILFITHDLNEAMRLGDKIAMMRDGEIVQIGTTEDILNEPANDYVAQFVQDVDRTRILTASSVMERPVAVLGSEQGPRSAHKLMREHQLPSIYVIGRDRTLRGILYENEVSESVRTGSDRIDDIIYTDLFTVGPDTVLADLFIDSAKYQTPLPVVDDSGRLLGIVPRVTLLNALGGEMGSNRASAGSSTDSPIAPEIDDVATTKAGE